MYAHLAGFHNYNVSSVSGPYSAIDPYVKPFFTPQFLSLSLALSLCRFHLYSYLTTGYFWGILVPLVLPSFVQQCIYQYVMFHN
jgi:hypothetical protein